jgi:predicted GH43/DUF377 family glycosyl hydrolase
LYADMSNMSLPIDITRLDIRLNRDASRVITKPFLPGEETFPDGQSRVDVVLHRILSLAENEVDRALASVRKRFGDRHRDLSTILLHNYQIVADRATSLPHLSNEHRLLAGAYFTHEFSIEAAALFNPSIVLDPDQTGVVSGEVRFIMSLRAVGEGHISSIEFRTGIIDGRGELRFDSTTGFATTGQRRTPTFDRGLFRQKLEELGVLNVVSEHVLGRVSAGFSMAELERAIASLESDGLDHAMQAETVRVLHLLANSNYIVAFGEEIPMTERVLFPSGPYESHGMEDARFVRFVDDDDSVMYFGTYTAFDGFRIIPQLIETRDFRAFRVATLNGQRVQNKGMALFPRKINGQYAMLSRRNRENIDLMFSHRVREWQTSEHICVPRQAWELIQIGNCGSPIETEAGWLVLTHGVGPMRTYAIGAILLDLDDPSRVIGRLKEPLIEPSDTERDGYVPNVVYTCGGIIHQEWLFMPYGFSDMGTRVAKIELSHLVDALVASPP